MTEASAQGLSSQEAARRLAQFGANELPVASRRDLLHIFLGSLREPLLLLLLIAAAIYFVLGDLTESLLLGALACVDIGIVVAQERRTERVLEGLRELANPRALVHRDGRLIHIPARDLVPGDLLVLSEGDRVAADARVVDGTGIFVDESLLTGESVPVQKTPKAMPVGERSISVDDTTLVRLGSLIVRGNGSARVTATGLQSELGGIGQSVSSIDFEKTRLHRMTERLTRNLAIGGILVSLVVGALQVLNTKNWLIAALSSITIAMSLLPEEIPVVLTVFLAIGAWRMARVKVLARRPAAIETLGVATVLCTDKTGTLTVNRMRVAALWSNAQFSSLRAQAILDPTQKRLLETAALASDAEATDPMEKAVFDWVDADSFKGLEATRKYPLSPDLLALTRVWRSPAQSDVIVTTKGAPEAIAHLCRLDGQTLVSLLAAATELAKQGLRVLGVARGSHGAELPDRPEDFVFEFCGLVAFADPIRDSVPDAVKQCQRAGIRVIMITGDHAATAKAIAAQAGIRAEGGVLTGAELTAMNDAQLHEAVKAVDIFARVRPEQKLRLVTALKASGDVVAMTGDGVNDAPALKAASIGIAMGGRGTDVAREAASLVLLDDKFESIVAAIRLGRRIFSNLRKALSYILSVHIPIAGLATIPLLLGAPAILLPIHIVFLEMIIDPVCSMVFEVEPEDRDIMDRPPRKSGNPLFARRDIGFSVMEGVLSLTAVMVTFAVMQRSGWSPAEVRTATFAVLVLTNLSLVFANRSSSVSVLQTFLRSNPILWTVCAIALLVLAGAIYVPQVVALFHFAPLPAGVLGWLLLPVAASLMLIELLKILRTRHKPK